MQTVWYMVAAVAVTWFGILSSVFLGGLLFLVFAVLCAGLKLAGIVAWSWWWIALPLWGAAGSTVAKLWAVTRDPMWRYKVR